MTARALIIAIEKYAAAQDGLDADLPGVLATALAFRERMIAKWRAEGVPDSDTEILFLSEPRQDFGSGASRRDILAALRALEANGANQTAEFFFFFSGHGFSFQQNVRDRSDVIVASDYESAFFSGPCCFKLSDIMGWLRPVLGPGKHYYFIDACRNYIDASNIMVGEQLTLPKVM